MGNIKGKVLIAGVAAVASAVAFGGFAWGEAVERRAEAALAEARRTQNLYGQGAAENEISEAGEDIPAPNLDRKVVVTAALTPEAREANLARIAELTKRVKERGELGDWLELGVYRKTIGDLDGAEEIWGYVALTHPDDGISLANLANLYLYERKDPKKAEGYLLGAIERASHQMLYYETAYELYHFVLKDDAKGKEVVMKGLLANPSQAEAFKDILARF